MDDERPNGDECGEFWEMHTGTREPPNEFVEAFVDGAVEAFREMQSKL